MIQSHLYVLVAHEFRQFEIRHGRSILAGWNRLFPDGISEGSCHLLQGILAEVSFGRQIRKTVGEAHLIWRRRQLSNLKRQLLGCASSLILWKLAQSPH